MSRKRLVREPRFEVANIKFAVPFRIILEPGGFPTLTKAQLGVAMAILGSVDRNTFSDEHRISPRTYDAHRLTIMHVLGLVSEVEILAYGIAMGYVRVERIPDRDVADVDHTEESSS